jgi:hypothetical protein
MRNQNYISQQSSYLMPTLLRLIILMFTLSRCSSWTIVPDRIVAPSLTVASARQEDFDFSSVLGWDQYYKCKDIIHDKSYITEWHNSIAFDEILKYISPGSSCLIVGCGVSRLPRVIYDAHNVKCIDNPTKIVCFDSSKECLEQLKTQFPSPLPESIDLVCGDVLNLTNSLDGANSSNTLFDIIIDKGLLDALLCGEGWNGPVESFMRESIAVMKPGSQYLLISYPLPKSTQTFLQDVTKSKLQWQFRMEGGNSRVQLSIATCH